MSNKKLITEVNDNVDGQGTSVHQINETEFPAEGMQPLPPPPVPSKKDEKDDKSKD